MAKEDLSGQPTDPAGAVKVFEPVSKNPDDQMVAVLEQIQALKAPSAEDYQKMVDPSNPFVSVFTGRAEVTQSENALAINSPTPLFPKKDTFPAELLAAVGVFALVYFLYLKGT